ncbi:MAG: hypothetical protein ACLQCU_10260 [Acidimicrobiales bacterium]
MCGSLTWKVLPRWVTDTTGRREAGGSFSCTLCMQARDLPFAHLRGTALARDEPRVADKGVGRDRRRHMRRARLGGLLAIAATSLPLLAGTTAVAASQRTTPTIGKQAAELMGSDTVALDYFGVSVATSGTTVVVGAPNHAKDVGRAYVFTNTAAGWKQAAELKGSDTVGGDYFGYSVAVSGTTVVVGAPGVVAVPAENGLPASPGRAYVFTKTAVGWTQVAELKGSDTVTNDNFGVSVATSGTTAVVGAPGHASFAGRAYVFAKTAAGWTQVAELKGSDTVSNDNFGVSVATSGTTAVVGAPGHGGFAGRAYVFTDRAAGWKQAAELKGSDTVSNDNFGLSVATSHTTVVVGAYDHASSGGRAYVFTKQGGGWKQAADLKGSDTIVGDGFGISVAASGTTVVVGASAHANSAGRAYVFTRTATGWKQAAELKGSDTVAADFFGYSVATSGTTVVVGAYAHASFAGRAYLFDV